MGRAGSPPYIASSARMNERSGRSREGAGGEKREARSERERASPEIFGDQEGMQNTVLCSTGRVCRGRGMACCKSCIIQHLDLESSLAFHVLLSHYRITERSTHEQT